MSEPQHIAEARFDRFLDEDRSRIYGFGPSYPNYIKATIHFLKANTVKYIRNHRVRSAEMILQMAKATEEQERALHASLAPHLAKLYEGKKFKLMELLLERAVDADPELFKNKALIMSIIGKLTNGFSEIGEVSRTGFWESLKPHVREQIEKEASEADCTRARSLPTRDHWASDEELAECWKQMEQMVADGLWFPGDVADIGENGASVAFPVVQGDPPKTRVCIDKRLQNLLILVSEKVRLFHSRTACEIMLACLSKTGHSPHFMQNRQDVAHDVEHERALREKIGQDFEMMFRARDLSQLPDEEDPDEESAFSFLPVSQKRDLVRFYYQCGSKDPRLNGIFFAKPFSLSHPKQEGEPASKRKKPQREWVLVFSNVAVFGSRTSVYECVHVSEALMAILNGPLKLLSTLYIDDVHSMGREQLIKEDEALIDLFFNETGWWSSATKKELQDLTRKKALVILGMAYTLVSDISIKVQVNPAKVLELLKKGRALILDIDNKCVKERAILNYKGLYRHVAQLDRLKIALAKALDFWQGNNFSIAIKKQSDRRQLRQSVVAMQDAATRVAPKILSAARSNMPVAHLYTDAAAENLSELNRLLQTGQRDGFEEFGLFLGGFLALPSGEKMAFKFQVTRFPQEVTKVTIGLLEAAAARIAIDYFKAELKGHYVVLHVDNLSDVYVLTRNSSREINTQRISSQFHRVAAEFDLEIFITWISTKRNVADALTRAARSLILEFYFPSVVPIQIQSQLALNPRLWGINQDSEGGPSSVFMSPA